MRQDFAGTGVATITPMSQGQVNYTALEGIIDFQIRSGVDYVVCLGTTGEATTLTVHEKRKVLAATLNAAAGRVPVVLGDYGGNNTAAIIERLTQYDLTGVSALLSASPAYNKPTQEGIFLHYQALAQATSLPIVLYNVPGRTSSNVLPDTVLRLAAAHPNIIGIKEASADLVQATDLLSKCPDNFLVLSGDDPTALPFIACGGHGIISVIANAFPASFSCMIRLALQGDFVAARDIHLAISPLHHWMYVEGNPAGVKGAMQILGKCDREVRLPLAPLTDSAFQGLQRAISRFQSTYVALGHSESTTH